MEISNLKVSEKTLKKLNKDQMTCKLSGTIGIIAPILSYSAYATSPSDITLSACLLSSFGLIITALSYENYKAFKEEKEAYEKAIKLLEINGIDDNQIVQSDEWIPTGSFKEFKKGTHIIENDEKIEGYSPYLNKDKFLVNDDAVVALEYHSKILKISAYPFRGIPLKKEKTKTK